MYADMYIRMYIYIYIHIGLVRLPPASQHPAIYIHTSWLGPPPPPPSLPESPPPHKMNFS